MDGGGGGTEGDTAAAGAPPHGIGLQLRWCRSGSSPAFWHGPKDFRFSAILCRDPLERTDHQPLHNLEEPLTRRHEFSRKRYTMALAGTPGLGLKAQ